MTACAGSAAEEETQLSMHVNLTVSILKYDYASQIDRAMMENYSHIRMVAKRNILRKTGKALMENQIAEDVPGGKVSWF